MKRLLIAGLLALVIVLLAVFVVAMANSVTPIDARGQLDLTIYPNVCDTWEWHSPNPYICLGTNCTNPEIHDNYPHNPYMGISCWPKVLNTNNQWIDWMNTWDRCGDDPLPGTIYGWRDCLANIDGNLGMLHCGYLHSYEAGYEGIQKSVFSWDSRCVYGLKRIDMRHDPNWDW